MAFRINYSALSVHQIIMHRTLDRFKLHPARGCGPTMSKLARLLFLLPLIVRPSTLSSLTPPSSLSLRLSLSSLNSSLCSDAVGSARTLRRFAKTGRMQRSGASRAHEEQPRRSRVQRHVCAVSRGASERARERETRG